MLTFWTVLAGLSALDLLYTFFVRPSDGMAAIAPVRRAAPIAVLATGTLLVLALAPRPATREFVMQTLVMVTSFWGTTIRSAARPYDPLRRMSILGLSDVNPTNAKR